MCEGRLLDLRAGSLRAELSFPSHIVIINHTLYIFLAYECVIHLFLTHRVLPAISLKYVTYASRALMRRNTFLLTRWFDQITHLSNQMNHKALNPDRTQLLAGDLVEKLATASQLVLSWQPWYHCIAGIKRYRGVSRPCSNIDSSPLSAEGLLWVFFQSHSITVYNRKLKRIQR